MNYTIIYTEDYQTGQSIDIVKEGNVYSVSFTDKKSFIRKRVKTIDEAQKLYITIVNYFIHGVYNFEQRAEILKDKKGVE